MVSKVAKELLMKFKELREADLSKAQIKKVHDKADDLPKNDFIKRYGKDGDAVRFATATNIVKKQLGIDEAIKGNDFVGVVQVLPNINKANRLQKTARSMMTILISQAIER